MKTHIFLRRCKGMPAQYGRFETFVEKLTAGKIDIVKFQTMKVDAEASACSGPRATTTRRFFRSCEHCENSNWMCFRSSRRCSRGS